MAISESAPLTDAERDWLHARAAALGLAPDQVHAAPLAETRGRLLLSSEPGASKLPMLRAGAGSVLLAETAHVDEGQALEITCPANGPVHVVLGRLTMAPRARLVASTHLTLEVATLAVDPAAGPVELIGKDGKTGDPGTPGAPGSDRSPDGGVGGTGHEGGRGEDGPGGTIWCGELTGTLTVIAGGGFGGRGGTGGRGGNGDNQIRPYSGGRGGTGGTGGRGGDAGDGGVVVIAFAKMSAGAQIHPLARPSEGGPGGEGGGPGENGRPGGGWGAGGGSGGPGNPGRAPDFIIRCDPDTPSP